jgi:hypothetical protein
VILLPILQIQNHDSKYHISWHTRHSIGPPLCSIGQSSWLQIQRFRVRFPALPDFLRNSGSGTGSTQPFEYRPGRTVGLWDVKDPTLSRQSSHRWR